MKKILFNLNGLQKLVEVHESGGVTSDAEILWDESVDGPIASDIEVGKMVRSGSSLVKQGSVLAAHASAIASVNQIEVNKQAREYLASTDWYIIRESETGTPCPQDIKDARAAARASIV